MPSDSMSMTASKSLRDTSRVAIGASNQREEVVLLPVLGSGHRDDLLRHHVERRLGDQQSIELALRNRSDERRAFDQLIARGREDAPFGLGRVLDLMAGAADALQRNGDRSRRADLTDEIDRADVDAELERCRRHHRLELSGLELLFRGQPQLARQAAVMRKHRVFAQPLGQIVGDALGQPPGVDEHQRRLVLGDQGGDAVVDLLPHLIRCDRPKLVLRHFDRQIHRTPVPVIDDRDAGVGVGREESRDRLDRPHCRRQADPLRATTAGFLDEIVEPRQREREMRTPLVVGHRVNLIDDDRSHAAQRLAAAIRSQQDEERLRGGDENVRRVLDHPLAFGRRCVAGAHGSADRRQQQSTLCCDGRDA